MKIAFIVSEFPALSETFILNQITGLPDRGHKVEIFADRPRDDPIVHPDVKKYGLLARTQYLKMPSNKLLCVTKAIWLIITNFHKNPRIILRTILRSMSAFKNREYALSLRLLYATCLFLNKGGSSYDIIHCHFGPNGILGVLLREVGAIKGKIVTTFHGYDMSAYIRRRGENVYSLLFKKGDLFLCVSNHWKEKLIKLGCDRGKIIVHRAGIDLRKFEYTPRCLQKGEKVKILTVGRLVEKKGHKYAIKAIAKVIGRGSSDLEYIIVGDGPLRSELETLVSKLGIRKNVKFLGCVSDEKLLTLYKNSHIFLLPSITASNGDKEGIPVVLMEAQATGMPIISTWHSGIPELVRDGTSGFLVPEKDVDALAEKLEYLIEHPEIWSKMGYAGRKIIETYYNIDKLNDQLVQIYQKLVNGSLSKNN